MESLGLYFDTEKMKKRTFGMKNGDWGKQNREMGLWKSQCFREKREYDVFPLLKGKMPIGGLKNQLPIFEDKNGA